MYSHSYFSLTVTNQFADGRNRPQSNYPPRALGSGAAPLLAMFEGGHYEVRANEQELLTLRLWLDTGAPYPGTYAALGSGMYHARLPGKTIKKRCAGCHDPKAEESNVAYRFTAGQLQSLCNLTRPGKSLTLRAPLAKEAGGLGLCGDGVFTSTEEPDYQKLLGAINAAAEQHNEHKRFDMPGFRPNEHYVREMQRFGILPVDLAPDAAIDVYDTDQRYWQSFWHTPIHPKPLADGS
jgi:hypothetical protein